MDTRKGFVASGRLGAITFGLAQARTMGPVCPPGYVKRYGSCVPAPARRPIPSGIPGRAAVAYGR